MEFDAKKDSYGCIVSTRTRKKKTCQTSIFPYLLVPGGPVAGSF
jgi:hypothetical protein